MDENFEPRKTARDSEIEGLDKARSALLTGGAVNINPVKRSGSSERTGLNLILVCDLLSRCVTPWLLSNKKKGSLE